MLNTLVLSPDARRQALLCDFVAAVAELRLRRAVDHNPTPDEFVRLAHAAAADVVLFDVSTHGARPVVIACGEGPAAESCRGLPGIAAVLPPQPDFASFSSTVLGAFRAARQGIQHGLFCFLPSKAGSGATTVALQTAFALARRGKRVLLIEADLRSGVLGLYLNRDPEGTVQSALANAFEGDLSALRYAVTGQHGVDFLLSNNALDAVPPSWLHYFRLLELATGQYDFVLVDLPELVNPATAEAVRRAGMALIVSTAEVAPLRFVRQRHKELTAWGVPDDRIAAILNRWQRSDIAVKDAEQLLHTPVYTTVPNDYPAIRSAILNGQSAAPSSSIARSLDDLAKRLAGGAADPKPRKSLFSVFR
jgi:MinD-like ATPase involved in chromosome partitioning or flagellar assembly